MPKPPKCHRKNMHIAIRISPHTKHWLKKKGYSVTKIFHEAIKELGYKK